MPQFELTPEEIKLLLAGLRQQYAWIPDHLNQGRDMEDHFQKMMEEYHQLRSLEDRLEQVIKKSNLEQMAQNLEGKV